MPFPVTIDTVSRATEAPGYFGPFQVGTSLYAVSIDPNTQQLMMFKSVDDGATWAAVDSLNGPFADINAPGTLDSVYYSSCQSTLDTNKIFVVYTDVNLGNDLALVVFNAGSDTWGIPSDSGLGYSGFFPLVCCYRPGDDSVVVAGSIQQVQTFVLFHRIVSYVKYNVAGDTWSGWTPMGYTDYSDVTIWDQKPCGICIDSGGTIHVFMQQLPAKSSPLLVTLFELNTAGSLFVDIPGDCTSLALYVMGAGGGGGGAGGVSGGGGGGGMGVDLAHSVTPGATINVVTGAGGPVDTDGDDSSVDGITGGGGKKGTGTVGGAGGSGTHVGGDGGATDGVSCGGGGGSPGYYITPVGISPIIGGGSSGDGENGTDSSGATPGAGGQEPVLAVGGIGGSGGTAGVDGSPGTAPGAGGGGGGTGHLPGAGADGLTIGFYTPVTNEHAGRMWHQSIDSSDTLGALQEITEGSFPIDGGPIPFDCKPGSGYVAIAFSGATLSTNGNISVGRANNGASLTFSFQSISAGNGGSGISPSPSIAAFGAIVVCFYLQVTSTVSCEFFYQTDGGSGFGGATSLGSFLDIGARLCVDVFGSDIKGCFGMSAQAEMLPVGTT